MEKSEIFPLKNRLTLFFEKAEKNMLFKNISKTTQYFFLIVSGPHKRVLRTFPGTFRIGKIGKFSTQKSPNVFFFLKKKAQKNLLFRNISKTTQYFFLIVSGPHRRVLRTFSGTFRIGKIGKFSTQKSPNVFFLLKKQNYKGFPL